MAARVVIAEKDYLTAAGYESLLGRLGLEVCGIVSTGPAVIEAAIRLSPDLLIIDAGLAHGSSGLFATAHIAEQLRLPVILISSSISEATARFAGAARLLHKPVAAPVLIGAVQDVLHDADSGSALL